MSSRTNHELDTPHRSFSTSILLAPNDSAAEIVLKLAYSRPSLCSSPIKRLYATELPSRIGAPPLVKIHKAFTTKRHSQSAEDLPQLPKPKVKLDTPHRSFSTSILLASNDSAAEIVLKLAYSRPKPLRSPIKRLYATELPSRIGAPPLVKIHKAFTTKRHSQSAEDLPQLAKPKVSFLVDVCFYFSNPE
ncbi:hypothetical protein T265_09700 [Opisthorchis viverrini]|uniref:Uncharacterized protein n=1 Tax=Opisthorchis viverrini TaxID=6198 RepID=A0A074Z4Z4_OPIVI|nr:hypothetical protein T265_09700 [Opisthorchis viverrini]KER22133.1 hypothetical protein T265_09700 [Opisthorchis viverrini]